MSRCGICHSPRQRPIDTLLSEGKTFNFIENEMKRQGTPAKAETVAKHLSICLKGDPLLSPVLRANMSHDFAQRIQTRAIEMADNGELKIRTQDGLAAQALLDRRAEKAADRELWLTLGRLLSGSRAEVPIEVIDGTYREIETEDGLAPTALVVVE